MFTPRRILICTADRAEKGLIEPIYKALSEKETVITKICVLDSRTSPTVNLPLLANNLLEFNPDIILVPCDRNEMTYATAYCFHQGYVVAHFHAGNNPSNHPDDINRRVISCFSHILLCHSEQHRYNLVNEGEEAWRCHVVGSTAFDRVELDDSVTPSCPFNLVVLHPNPESFEKTSQDLEETRRWVTESNIKTIWIAPNPDKYNEVILNSFNQHDEVYYGIKFLNKVEHSQFLSLLKNCAHAVGNSSSFYYELPRLCSNSKVVQIGERNKGLIVPEAILGASDRIADLLSTIEINDDLRFKRLTK